MTTEEDNHLRGHVGQSYSQPPPPPDLLQEQIYTHDTYFSIFFFSFFFSIQITASNLSAKPSCAAARPSSTPSGGIQKGRVRTMGGPTRGLYVWTGGRFGILVWSGWWIA